MLGQQVGLGRPDVCARPCADGCNECARERKRERVLGSAGVCAAKLGCGVSWKRVGAALPGVEGVVVLPGGQGGGSRQLAAGGCTAARAGAPQAISVVSPAGMKQLEAHMGGSWLGGSNTDGHRDWGRQKKSRSRAHMWGVGVWGASGKRFKAAQGLHVF